MSSPPTSPGVVAPNSDLVWLEIPIHLRNRRAPGHPEGHPGAKVEHPAWVLTAILRHAAPRIVDGRKTVPVHNLPPGDRRAHPPIRYLWRPDNPLPDRVEFGYDYRITVMLPQSHGDCADSFREGIVRHLERRESNHDLVTLGSTEEVRLSRLVELAPAFPAPTGTHSEVCLLFHTPIPYVPQDPQAPWHLSAANLGAAMAKRLEGFLKRPFPFGADAWKPLRSLDTFWHRAHWEHRSSSGKGGPWLTGCVGPLYLRGTPEQLQAIRPWLVAGQHLGAGDFGKEGLRFGVPAGNFTMVWGRGEVDANLLDPRQWHETLRELEERTDLPDSFERQLGAPDTACAELAQRFDEQSWTPAPAIGFPVAKRAGTGKRLVVQFPARDRLVHQTLHQRLAPVFDRMFEPQSHGYRLGRSTETVRRFVESAWRDGYSIVLESDIEAFFDSVRWEVLERQIDEALPLADTRTRAALAGILRTPVRVHGRPAQRESGLLQGSPLSPLLANLHLDPFDEAMTRAGFRMVRYADDFLVLCRSEAEADAALKTVDTTLGNLGLALNRSKTAITPFNQGFTFLGLRFGGGFQDELVSEAGLQRTVFLHHPHAWVGVDHDAMVIRARDTLVARVPFRRVGELVLLGTGGASQRLIERCSQKGIPISFCTAAGKLQNTLWRHDAAQYALSASHALRHGRLTGPEHLMAARAIVAAKLHNYAAWFRERATTENAELIRGLQASISRLDSTASIEEIRGVEGAAARQIFQALNLRAPADFRSDRREPGQGYDRWNSLLDFAYSLLFARINTLIRLRGLVPYLGILHSSQARYESLVCDLQEPFRVRCDRLVLKLVNRQQIRATDFAQEEAIGGLRFAPRLVPEAVARFLEAFAAELDTQLAGEPASWAKLIETQVYCVQRWVQDESPLCFYHSQPGLVPPPAPKPPTEIEEAMQPPPEDGLDIDSELDN